MCRQVSLLSNIEIFLVIKTGFTVFTGLTPFDIAEAWGDVRTVFRIQAGPPKRGQKDQLNQEYSFLQIPSSPQREPMILVSELF